VISTGPATSERPACQEGPRRSVGYGGATSVSISDGATAGGSPQAQLEKWNRLDRNVDRSDRSQDRTGPTSGPRHDMRPTKTGSCQSLVLHLSWTARTAFLHAYPRDARPSAAPGCFVGVTITHPHPGHPERSSGQLQSWTAPASGLAVAARHTHRDRSYEWVRPTMAAGHDAPPTITPGV
jgi:hypothetical protein